MFSGHFYHATLRRIVSVFGTLFNNISVVTKDQTGKVVRITRVPLAYGPKQKFLARIDEQPDLEGTKVAIKLPRMSFEIVSLTYDITSKIGSLTQFSAPDLTDPGKKRQVRSGAPYRVGLQLSIIAKNQDDALQVLEQILPFFQPEYTVTIKDVDGLDTKNDVPIVLNSVQLTDDYEGDFMSRRAIVYTLDFELRVRFYGPIADRKVIKTAMVDLAIDDPQRIKERITIAVDPITAGPNDSYSVVESINFLEDTSTYSITVQVGSGSYTVGEDILGLTSGRTAKVRSFADNVLVLVDCDGPFVKGEVLQGQESTCIRESTTITPIWG